MKMTKHLQYAIALIALIVIVLTAYVAGARNARQAEYVRVVSAVADAYGYDPSEVEMDAGLVDAQGEIKR